ncbi:precorrin-3B C(17)-methyltransferase, partial [Treponema zioleckii]|uniref:precorrin-3B C(17)-methyltransferase n=1 Tax=Treponema zioleckii TaxID=331680 RepID=UPI00168AC2C5
GLTHEAKVSIQKADLIVGYTKYIELIQADFPEKNYFSTGMMKEADRCEHALKIAGDGKTVTLVCSGDSGVYGMASLVLEISAKNPLYNDVEIEIIPGVTAALSGSAILGSPLTNDFVVLSLSNLLTPQELIEKRLRAAAAGDFSMAIYNPRSKNRPDVLKNACKILLETLPKNTICGWVRNIGREGEDYGICTLNELSNVEIDMFCTVFIGNSATQLIEQNGRKWIVTRRGYKKVDA